MLNYARSDTHFLLYIYDNMRNELIDRSNSSLSDGKLIDVVMNKSKEETLQRYERPFYDIHRGSGPMGWYHLFSRLPALFNREQFSVFRAVHQWRDTIARQEDESTHHIMPRHVLYNIARELPLDISALVSCSHPMSIFFRKRKQELLAVIKNARLLGATGPEVNDLMQPLSPVNADSKIQVGIVDTTPNFAQNIILTPHRKGGSAMSMRTNYSRFWGKYVFSNAPDSVDLQIKRVHEQFYLTLPLPQLTAEICEDVKISPHGEVGISQADTSTPTDHQYLKQTMSTGEDVFVVSQIAEKRRRILTSPSEDFEQSSPKMKDYDGESFSCTDSDRLNGSTPTTNVESNIGAIGGEQWPRGHGLERRPKKKRLKSKHLSGNGQRSRDVEAFDYTNAPSFLYGDKHDMGQSGLSKSVNP